MSKTNMHQTPETGWKSIKHWRNDFIAAISVSLVALPLAIGVAEASGVTPMSGVLAAIIGGVVVTLFRGGHVAINGPAAGLIAVILGATYSLDDGSGKTFNYILAAITIAGALQTILGIFKLGRFADIFPSSVITGIMAAIGILIFASQIHVALGTGVSLTHPLDKIRAIFTEIPNINPFVAVISVAGILLLIFHSKISYKLFHFLPAQIWVLALSIPFVYAFNFFEPHSLSFLGKAYAIDPKALLIEIPGNILDAIAHPDFSKIDTIEFWVVVISICLIASLQTLAMAKAVDKLDPYHRKTNLNKDLIGMGIGTMVAGALGGLPIITVIVRSKVNVQNNAKTSWSNFYHGALLLVFVILLTPVLQQMPKAAFAAILVFIGFKLAAPRVFANAYKQGIEQLIFVVCTMGITVWFNNLLAGIFGGILFTLVVHVLLARVPLSMFFSMIFKSGTKLYEKKNGSYELEMKGISNFLSMIKLNKILETVPEGADLKINMTNARLIDMTVLENLENFKRNHKMAGGKVQFTGLEHHTSSTNHRMALKSLHSEIPYKLTYREKELKELSQKNAWTYRHFVKWDDSTLRNFQFFEIRPIERKENVITGNYPKLNISWEISDITFDEGALIASEVYHTTVQQLQLPVDIPKFVIEKEGYFDKIFDRVMAFTGQKDIDFTLFTDFSDKFLLKGEDEAAIRTFFTPSLIQFLEDENIYHIESNGDSLLIFKYLRLAQAKETTLMLDFSERLIESIEMK